MKLEFQIRQATVNDVTDIFNLIKALAEYEKLTHQVTGTKDDLHNHLFGSRIYAEAVRWSAPTAKLATDSSP